jgi:hypothetical protein
MSAEMVAVSWPRYRHPAPCFLISNRFWSTRRAEGPPTRKQNQIEETVEGRSEEMMERLRTVPVILVEAFLCCSGTCRAVSASGLAATGVIWIAKAFVNKALGALGDLLRAISTARCSQPDHLSWRVPGFRLLCSWGDSLAQFVFRDRVDQL